MKQKLRVFLTLLLCAVASVGWGEEITYTFQSKSWTAVLGNSTTPANWTSGKDGSGFTRSQGVQVTTSTSGANATSPDSYANISKIVVVYNTNKTSGKGAIKIQVGDNDEISNNVAYSGSGDGRSANYTTEFDNINQSGHVKLTVTCSTNSIYVHQIIITYNEGGSTETVATPTFSPAAGTYTEAQPVTLSCATAGSSIYFTTDGTEPTSASTLYQGAINVAETTTIKAIAYVGEDASTVATAIYTIIQHAGTAEDPYSVADARAYLNVNPAPTEEVYIEGIISQVDVFNSQYNSITYWISDDGSTDNQFEVYSGKGLNGADFNSVNDLIKGSKVVVKGTIKLYNNSVYEFNHSSEIVSMESVTFPVINAEESLELPYNATNGSFNYSITNPKEGKSLTATPTADWISNIQVGEESVTFTTTQNDGTANRTATITLAYEGAESVEVTVTQKFYVADYATLPFDFNDGRADIEGTAGLTQKGLGTDYSDDLKLKFDNTGDELVLKFNERPGVLTFDIKNNSFSGGTFSVQTSVNGTDYTTLKDYTEISGTQNEEFTTLDADIRYIKWVYTEKVSGNVALGNIKLEAYVALQNFTLTIPETDNVTITAAYGEDQMIEEGQNAEIEQNTEIILTVDAAEGYELKSLTVTGPDGQSFTPRAVAGTEGAYKFTMPSYNATISVNVEEYVAPTTATYVLATEVVSGKQYVIASGTSGDVKVMGDQNSNNRAAVDATIGEDGKLSVSEDYEFVIESTTIDEKSGYSIFDASENGGYLYAASSGSNHLKTQVKNNANGLWTIEFDTESGVASIVAQGTNTRNVMQYNNGSNLFSCYGSASQAPVYLFEKVEDTPQPKTIEVKIGETATGADGAYYSSVYYSDKALKVPAGVKCLTYKVVDGALTVSKTYNADDVIPAGEAVVIKASASGTVTFPVTLATADKDTESMLLGVDVAETINVAGYKYYKLTLNAAKEEGTAGFYFDKNVTDGSTINAAGHKCYLRVPVDQTNGAKGFVFGEETDGIGQIEMGQTSNAAIYNLNGQKVNKAQKGIYIVNGKKVVIK